MRLRETGQNVLLADLERAARSERHGCQSNVSAAAARGLKVPNRGGHGNYQLSARTRGPDARIVAAGDFNAAPDEVPVMAIRGDIENTGNPDLVNRILVPIEHTIPAPARYTLFHQGHGEMLDHMLITRNLLAHYHGSEIHNEVLHDESAAFADDPKYPESDHAPVVATFDF